MQPKRLNKNLKKANALTELVQKKEETLTPEINSWQTKVLVVKGPQQNCWLIDSVVNVHMCNNWSLMTKNCTHPTKIGGSILDGILPRKRKIRLRLALKDSSESLIFNFQNVFYLLNSPCNLLSLSLLNNSGIYLNIKNETLYKIYSR